MMFKPLPFVAFGMSLWAFSPLSHAWDEVVNCTDRQGHPAVIVERQPSTEDSFEGLPLFTYRMRLQGEFIQLTKDLLDNECFKISPEEGMVLKLSAPGISPPLKYAGNYKTSKSKVNDVQLILTKDNPSREVWIISLNATLRNDQGPIFLADLNCTHAQELRPSQRTQPANPMDDFGP